MSTVVAILVMATGVYVVRLGGLLLAGRSIPRSWDRVLTLVPVATLTALVVVSLAGRADEAWPRAAAAVAAGVAAWRERQVWVCLVVGLGVYWLLRLA
jgi:branched-subunit amino acid transport protein